MPINKNILLIVPDERKVYEKVNVRVGAFHLPSLALAILGAISKANIIIPSPGSPLYSKIHSPSFDFQLSLKMEWLRRDK